ncbi:response regulator transcription factor [Streptomyces sp. KM77-8]|uniref:Response regulator transcription factor n=1 Tax=Streptomyces haneummycinicus TaxID=3074435 RepID=A0AAT9HUZ2_9ACTN
MKRIILSVQSTSLRRRIRRILTADGCDWDVTECGSAEVSRSFTSADVVITQSNALGVLNRVGIPVIVLVDGDRDDFWGSTHYPHVAGVLDRDDPHDEIVTAVREVGRGRGWISPELVSMMLSAATPHSEVDVTELTCRENEVMNLVAQGHSNSEVADRLCIELSTVKFHVSNILRKLGCRDRVQLAAMLHAQSCRKAGCSCGDTGRPAVIGTNEAPF